MKVVFMCEFCERIFDHEKYAIEHENDCGYNPCTKKCPTCKKMWGEREDSFGCKIKTNNTHEYMYQVLDGDVECPDYIKKEN